MIAKIVFFHHSPIKNDWFILVHFCFGWGERGLEKMIPYITGKLIRFSNIAGTGNDDIQLVVENNSEKNNIFAEINKNNDDLRQRNRQVLSERFSPEKLKRCDGIPEEAEALLMGGNESSVPEKQEVIIGNIELGKKKSIVLYIVRQLHSTIPTFAGHSNPVTI